MRFITEAEVAEQLGLPANILPSLRRAGKGPKHYKFGNKSYYETEVVEAWLTTCVQDPSADPDETDEAELAEEEDVNQ